MKERIHKDKQERYSEHINRKQDYSLKFRAKNFSENEEIKSALSAKHIRKIKT